MKNAIVTLLLVTSTALAGFAQAPAPEKDEGATESTTTEAIEETPAAKETGDSKQVKPAVKDQDSKEKGKKEETAEKQPEPGKQIAEEKANQGKEERKKKKPIPYPLETCIVTGNELGSMGDPVTFNHEDREIKVCCKPCEKKYLKDPARYLVNLETE